MISGPEVVRLLKEFKSSDQLAGKERNHEQGLATQMTFIRQVNSLCEAIKDMGNPFLEESGELMKLDTHDVVDQRVKTTLETMESVGQDQYEEYVKSVLIERTKPIQSPIKKNNVVLFKTPIARKSKVKLASDDLKSDYSLFSQLFIASQVREGDLDEFFAHENHPWPPSLSKHGQLRLPSCKSELLDCIAPEAEQDKPSCDSKVFDGAVVVHALAKGDANTFGDYSQNVFLP